MKKSAPSLLVLALTLLAAPLLAQSQMRSMPQAVPISPSIPDAVDTPYPGTITLDVDGSDIARGAWRVVEQVPLAPGTSHTVLQYPRWLPGHHAPSGAIDQLNDIRFFADGKPLTWHRDPVEIYAFHMDVPAGSKAVTAKFTITSPLRDNEGRVTMTPEMLSLQWTGALLYPAGHYVRQIRVKPSLTVSAGWQVATALDGKQQSGNRFAWAETDLETLIDSPLFAGVHFKRFDLGQNVAMNVVADKVEYLAIKPEHLATYRALVDEGLIAFNSHHFDHYDFLVGLTEKMGGVGLEHHRSSENTMQPKALTDWAAMDWNRNIVAHEFAHSWDGKFRRPAKLWTPDYRTPMQNNLLWVYEGQTQFWGLVLAARSGVQSKDMVLAQLATSAGLYSQQPGRAWRSLEDTTHDEIMNGRRAKPFASLARGEDYYNEGALIWLEVDQIIRSGTAGKKGIDDFARAFFGIKDGDWGEVTYEFDDVVAALRAVYPYDWATFLNARINTPDQPAPVAGIIAAGYRLVWRDEPNTYDKARFADAKLLSLYHSLGASIDKDGKVIGARWDSPAFNAGLVAGVKIMAVNGMVYDADGMKAAITGAKGTGKAIDLIVQRGDRVQSMTLDYHDGLRYPWLERVGKAEVGLDRLLAPRRGRVK